MDQKKLMHPIHIISINSQVGESVGSLLWDVSFRGMGEDWVGLFLLTFRPL
ncbi:hypothetical protein Hanom_Chr09g00810021 [Helianthus anomalus]